jgi:hypothetical protein
MKKLSILLVLLCQAVLALSITPPKEVSEKFSEEFPEVKFVKWKKEGNNFEAEYKKGGMMHSVTYDPSGKWLEKESGISQGELPLPAQEDCRKNFPRSVIDKVEKLEFPDGTMRYELELRNNAIKKNLQYDKDGKLLNK